MNNQIKRDKWFLSLKTFLRAFVKKPRFIYKGKKIAAPSIILSNHVGASAPLKFELYLNEPFRIVGTHEMTEGLKNTYRYLADTYFYKKKHFPKLLAKIVAFIVCPVVNLFYKGLDIIPSYNDARFKTSVLRCLDALKKGQNLIIFPEDSSEGYHDKLTAFLPGFAFIAKKAAEIGIDVAVYAAYYRKRDDRLIIDEPIKFSSLLKDGFDKQRIASVMLEKTNALATIETV